MDRFPPPRRHSTVPTSFQPAPPRPAAEPATDGSVETLYNHPSVKIVAFSAGRSAFDRPSHGAEEKPGTLPSSSRFERTIAVGGFQIYRAPGSVAFLRSGSALQPILPKSQAWCLDEQSSKFVLQIRRPNYWRIEVPVGNDDEARRALVLRQVLDRVLQFEKTPCPFERSFTVELPERPSTPVKKRPWTPPVRTTSLNWPPVVQPVTPPPEFPCRTRFYNPGARRFSDLGVDTSRLSLTPGTPPQRSEESAQNEVETRGTPSRRPRTQGSPLMCKPLFEEAEPLSPPPTAVPSSIAQITDEPLVQSPRPDTVKEVSNIAAETSATETKMAQAAPLRKREPIWITRKVPSSATRKARKAAQQAPALERRSTDMNPVGQDSSKSTEPSTEPATEDRDPDFEYSPRHTKETPRNDSSASEASGGSLEGAGQLHVRRTRVAAFASRRAATAPSLRLRTWSTSTDDSARDQTRDEMPKNPPSPTESLDSFHSTQSWHSPLSPPTASPPPVSPTTTYPFPHDNIPLAHVSKVENSEFTATPTLSAWDRNSVGAVAGSGPLTPDTPFTDIPEGDAGAEEVDKRATPMPTAATRPAEEDADSASDTDSLSTSWSSAASHNSNSPMRPRASTTSVAISHTSPRGLSPLPPAVNLLTTDLTNRATSAARTIRRIPSSIFNKTCEILISPPAHLISLMLKIAARITAGEWEGYVLGMGDGGEVVDVRWDWSDDRDLDDDGPALEGWAESDFDFGRNGALQKRDAARKARANSATTDLPRPQRTSGMVIEYQDPWATPPIEPDMDESEHWSRSWGVD